MTVTGCVCRLCQWKVGLSEKSIAVCNFPCVLELRSICSTVADSLFGLEVSLKPLRPWNSAVSFCRILLHIQREREREREREGERERERERGEREKERGIERQIERQRETDRGTDRQRDRHRERHTKTETGRQTDRQT